MIVELIVVPAASGQLSTTITHRGDCGDRSEHTNRKHHIRQILHDSLPFQWLFNDD